MSEQFNIEWDDHHREPKCKPNPAYPEGIDVDVTKGADLKCTAKLPYPAKRCGLFLVTCLHCGIRVGVTTAGRPDDPRSISIPCSLVEA